MRHIAPHTLETAFVRPGTPMLSRAHRPPPGGGRLRGRPAPRSAAGHDLRAAPRRGRAEPHAGGRPGRSRMAAAAPVARGAVGGRARREDLEQRPEQPAGRLRPSGRHEPDPAPGGPVPCLATPVGDGPRIEEPDAAAGPRALRALRGPGRGRARGGRARARAGLPRGARDERGQPLARDGLSRRGERLEPRRRAPAGLASAGAGAAVAPEDREPAARCVPRRRSARTSTPT